MLTIIFLTVVNYNVNELNLIVNITFLFLFLLNSIITVSVFTSEHQNIVERGSIV